MGASGSVWGFERCPLKTTLGLKGGLRCFPESACLRAFVRWFVSSFVRSFVRSLFRSPFHVPVGCFLLFLPFSPHNMFLRLSAIFARHWQSLTIPNGGPLAASIYLASLRMQLKSVAFQGSSGVWSSCCCSQRADRDSFVNMHHALF